MLTYRSRIILVALLALGSKCIFAAAESAPPASPAPAMTPPPKITFGSCHVSGPYIAMTFDDGPSAQNTPRLLDILKERNIKATFFMVGENAAKYPEIVHRIAEEGQQRATSVQRAVC
jgi:peptidoglycan/xylan/chitin deacetylase (PgdA/CDA1 family)